MIRFLFVALLAATSAAPAAASEAVVVHRFVANNTWDVNTWILESAQGVVLIDAQLRKSDADKIAALVDSLGKPLVGILLTHDHPDHVGGLATLRDHFPEVPIFATAEVAAGVALPPAENKEWFEQTFGDDLYTRVVKPNRIIQHGQTLELAGISLQVDVLGAGEAESNVAFYLPSDKLLFPGDMIMAHYHHYVGRGHPQGVLDILDYLSEHYADAALFMSGHGPAAPPRIAEQHRDYVRFVRDQTLAALAQAEQLDETGQHLSRAARREVAQKIIERFPYLGDFGITQLQITALNIYGVELEAIRTSNE